VKARLALRVALLLGLGSLTGCGAVAPWERGTLAQPQMAPDPWPQQRAWRGHVQSSREGIVTPGGTEGGGCGCY
jgi:hypothetical protein